MDGPSTTRRALTAVLTVILLTSGAATSTSAQSSPPTTPPPKTTTPSKPRQSRPKISGSVALPGASRNDTMVVAEPTPNGVVVLTSTGGALHPVVTLAVDGMTSRLWTGYSCTTGSGRYAAVTFAPAEFVDHEDLRDRGAFLAVVDVAAGTAKVAPERVAIKYHTPGCGPTDEIAAVRTTADGSTEVLRVDPHTGAISSRISVARHLIAPAPVGNETYLAADSDLVRVRPGAAPVTVASGQGELVDLTSTLDGGVDLLELAKDQATLRRVSSSGRSLSKPLATGPRQNMRLSRSTGGAVQILGNPASSDGSVKVTRTASAVRSVSLSGSAVISPSNVADTTVPGSEGAVARSVTVKATATGAESAATLDLAAPMVAGLAVANTTTPACAVPRMDYHVQALQPSPAQVEWAANKAVRGELTATVPATVVTPAFSPQGAGNFPLKALHGGGRVPVQVLLGVLAQESNLWQAAKGALPGVAADPIIGDYYGVVYNGSGQITGFDYAHADCGYGAGQVTTGMTAADTTTYTAAQKLLIATNYQANIAASLNVLIDKWNSAYDLGLTMNSGSPQWVEDWYVAVWAYNTPIYTQAPKGVGWTNNPANSDWNFARRPYLRAGLDDALHPGDWAYEEKVMGYTETGLYIAGKRAFEPVSGSLQLPVTLTGEVDRFRFCSPTVNNCSPTFDYPGSTPQQGDQSFCMDTSSLRACHWGAPNAWTSVNGTPENPIDYSSGPEPASANPYPPSCTANDSSFDYGTLNAVPTGTKIVDDIPDMKWNLVGCGAKPSDGSFSLSYGSDANGLSLGKIDTHQIGVGYGGHAYYSHTIDPGRPANTVTGTWSPPTSSVGWTRIMAHIPANGAETSQADYRITAGSSSSFHRTVNQRWNEDIWVDLGVFNLAPGASVSLSNVAVAEDANKDREVDIAWDAMAFVPSVKPTLSMVSFGDSYTAGEGDEPYQPNADVGADTGSFKDACHRSTLAYPAIAYAQMSSGIESSSTFHSSACSGAVIDDVAGNLIADGTDHYVQGEVPQLKQGWLDANTTLVTVGISGNDARFSTVLSNCVGTTCGDDGYTMAGDDKPLRQKEAQIIDTQHARLKNLVTKIRSMAPNAKIVLVGYPRVVNQGSFPACPFRSDAVTMFAELGDRLNTVISQAAYDTQASFVSLEHTYEGHEACSSIEEWINAIILRSSSGSGDNTPGSGTFHPKALGHGHAGPEVARVATLASPITYAPFPSLDAAIKAQFVDFDARQPTTTELSQWRSAIGSGTSTLDDLVVTLSQSAPFTDDRASLVRLYWAYFLRVPDLSGFNYWLGHLQDGSKSLTQVSSTYAGSSEFTHKYGSLSNRDFVSQIYQNVYERDPDAGGLDYWTGKLDSKAKTRGQVMLAFSEASEGIRHLKPRVDIVLVHYGTIAAMPSEAVFDSWFAGQAEGVSFEGNTRNLRLSDKYAGAH